MNGQVVTKNIGKAHPNDRTSTLLEKLRKKVKNFIVIDRQGQQLGEVQDLIVDPNGQLNLVISQQTNQQVAESSDPLFQLKSQLITKIDKSTKCVFLNIDKSEIKYMPEYLGTATPNNQNPSEKSTEQLANSPTINSLIESANFPETEVSEEHIIRLLEERLLVESSKRKVGEVIVRKEIETRMVQVPVRREKLIVEQVSPEYKQLAEIDLGQGEISGIELSELEKLEVTSFNSDLTVSGEFNSPKIASLLLNAIALELNHGCKQVRVTIAVEDETHQKKYQEWFDRCSKGQIPKPEK